MKKNLMLLFACMLSLQVFSQSLYPNDELIVIFADNINPNEIQTFLTNWEMYIVDGPTGNLDAMLLKFISPPIIPLGGNPFGPINGIKEDAETETKVEGVGFNFTLATTGSNIIETIMQDNDPCYTILDPNTQPNGGNAVTSAIFDTGIGQFQISGNNFVNPYDIGHNYINPTTPPRDDNDHGSHITSIFMNNLDNANSAIQLKSYKTHEFNGQGSIWNVIQAVDQAIADQVQIINMSFSYYIDHFHSDELKAPLRIAIRTAKEMAGILCIAAAGNNNNDNDFIGNLSGLSTYPASFDEPNIISVASANCQLLKSSFSNYGITSVDVFAPGEDILGYNQYGQVVMMSGTSQATAFVTKLATYLGTFQQSFSWEFTKCAILSGVVPIPTGGYVLTEGYINSVNSLNFLLNGNCTNGSTNRLVSENNNENLDLTVTAFANQSRFNILANHDFEAEVYITSTNGQIIYKDEISIQKGSWDYDINFNPSNEIGIYFLSIKGKNKTHSFKFIR